MPGHAAARTELLARIRRRRGELAEVAERIATAQARVDVRELKARTEKIEGELGPLLKLLDSPAG